MLRLLALAAVVCAQEWIKVAVDGTGKWDHGLDYDIDNPYNESTAAGRKLLQTCRLGTLAGCSTAPAAGITNQIVARMRAMGYSFPNLDTNQARCSSPCMPFMQGTAANGLYAAVRQRGIAITLNSAYRSSAQQYLLRRWFEARQCSITAAANPGTSNHEDGRAIDTSDYTAWRPALEANGWRWFGSGDVVHFDFVGGGAPDLRAINLRAFQQLWNINNPNRRIAEDGIYGPATAGAFADSPCNGW